jgi:general secretion pathway protein J
MRWRAPARAASAGSSGFTLLEVLVALVVLGFLLAGLSQGTRFGLQAWAMQTRTLARQSDMDDTYRVLREMIQQADPGELNQNGSFTGTQHTLSVLTRLPVAALALGVLDADVVLGVDARHRFVLRAEPHPHAEQLGRLPPPLQSTLLEGVDHVDFSYYRAAQKPLGWTSVWHDADAPALVRLHIVFSNDKARHWPDFVAAPVRNRVEE